MPECLTLAHSPDSDDLVMWWPLVGMTDADGQPVEGELGKPSVTDDRFTFELLAEDVQALNRRAIETADLDITAVSAHAYPHIKDAYRITATAGSFGEGYGPKLVAPEIGAVTDLHDLGKGDKTVAVPGVHTSAYLTTRLLVGRDFPIIEKPFEEVAGAVLKGEAQAGLLIHEAQLTTGQGDDLQIIADIGAEWDRRFGMPLPLGLNVVKRDLDDRFGAGTVEHIARLLERSVHFAVEHRAESREFLRMRAHLRPEWADDALVERYLDMYVSGLTLNMGERGVGALRKLLGDGHAAGLCPDPGPIDVAGLSSGA
ncbi:MAG: MqnA/MqnD/SBP family protein [Planctomycetota bacterium]